MSYNTVSAQNLIDECRKNQNPNLDLGNCGITDLNNYPDLFECVHLKVLTLCENWNIEGNYNRQSNNKGYNSNNITVLPQGLSKLKNLVTLICSNSRYSGGQISDISVLSGLPNLKYLDLSGNSIIDCSPLENLTSLEYIDVNSNSISDCTFLLKLTKLRCCNLRNNNVREIPSFVIQSGLKISFSQVEYVGLCLLNNPIKSPPIEILKQGYDSILDWFDATKQKLNEIKLILIGDPKAGKTSFLRKLKDDKFDKNEQQTDGINIEDIQFGTCKTFKEYKSLHNLTGHFWDFGGQEIMNSTHQFFLTNRSVYILIIDARKDKDVAGHIKDWVKRVRVSGGDSPIIIIANQIDINPGFGFSNESQLKEEFPQIKAFIKISCKTGENIELVKQKLEEWIPQAELFNTEIDVRWIGIMKQLQEETKQKYYLDEARFNKICTDNKLTDKRGRKNAINFLHDLGLVLHFEELNLAEYYVLDPYWITYGVYQIVTSAFAGTQKGIVPMDKLEFILNEEEDKKQAYKPVQYKKIIYESPNQRRFLVDILNQFKLSFYLPDKNYFIIPDLLDTKEPEKVTEKIRQGKNSIGFIYEFDYLPNSIIPNIMVLTHDLLLEKWRTGCVLQSNNCLALIISYQNRISITITGGNIDKREFLVVIRHLIDGINKDLKDKPQKLIPLPGINAFADYDVLLYRAKNNKTTYIHDMDKPTEKEFPLSQLLDGVDDLKGIKDIYEMTRKILVISKKTNSRTKSLVLGQKELQKGLTYLLTQSKIDKKEIIKVLAEVNNENKEKIVCSEIMKYVAKAFEIFDIKIDDKLKAVFSDMQQTDDVQMKLQLSIPLINILGVNFQAEWDVKKWAKKMYDKYELQLFKLFR